MSAVANAENNHGLDVNDLVVSEAYVGKNLIMKRFAARGRGRASSIMKPFSQITVIVRQTRRRKARASATPPRRRARSKTARATRSRLPRAPQRTPGRQVGEAARGQVGKPAKREDASAKSKSSAKPGKPGKGKETE